MTRALYLYCHAWRRPRFDRVGLWPQLVLGFCTVDLLPHDVHRRIGALLGDLRTDFGRRVAVLRRRA